MTGVIMKLRFIFVLLVCLSIPIFSVDPIHPVMISVRGGTFFMGSNENRVTEKIHEVTVRPFSISDAPVTQDMYFAVMGENPSRFKVSDNPVETVSWFDAVRFCNALSVRNGFAPAYVIEGESVTWIRESRGYRLPTEAEWEFAARGGNYGILGPLDRSYFAGGDAAANPQDYCWFSANAKASPRGVRGKLPNQLGLYDMSGNVWEWCWDFYDDYPAGPVFDYTGAASSRKRVMRGGCHVNIINLLRTTYRYWESPAYTAPSVGFRIAQNN
jgi:formylglycine-generating enzyme required for sulfatase activity